MFIYKNKESTDFNIKVLKSNHLDCFRKRTERISIPGRTGDLLLWDGSYDNLDINIKCLISKGLFDNLNELEEEILLWLDSNKYEDLRFKDGKIFKAYFNDYSEREEIGNNKLLLTINFTAFKEDI